MLLDNSRPLFTSLLASTAIFSALSFHSKKSAAAELIVPAYFYPNATGSDWDILNITAARNATTVIMNPNSGPGEVVDPNYLRAIGNLRSAGGKVVGYVSTAYSNRPISDVINDINKYVAFYQIDGFFIDEMTPDVDASHTLYYQSVYNYVKALSPGYEVIGNPGMSTEEVYASIPLADKLVVFEARNSNYNAYAPSGWQANYPSKRFINIVYDAPVSTLMNVMKSAAYNNIGGVFITSGDGSNPYNALPSYWSQETNLAKSLPTGP